MKKIKIFVPKKILFYTINALILLHLYACKPEPQKQPQPTPPQPTAATTTTQQPITSDTTHTPTTHPPTTTVDTLTKTANMRSANSAVPQTPQEIQQQIETQAKKAINALQNKNFAEFANFAHPTKGVRWTPNFTIDPKTDPITPANEIPNLLKNPQKKMWGYHSSSGDPLEFPFAQYYQRYVYSHNFSNPSQLSYNKTVVKSNSTNNHTKIYPQNTNFTEFYVKGTNPKYAGLDWGSLTFVWQKHTDNNWYIVNVIHGGWSV